MPNTTPTGDPTNLGCVLVNGTNIGSVYDWSYDSGSTGISSARAYYSLTGIHSLTSAWTNSTFTFNNTYTNSTSTTDLMDCIELKNDIDIVMAMPLEELPLHMNDKYHEIAKRVLDLRLKAQT